LNSLLYIAYFLSLHCFNILHKKKLLTQIERKEFYSLVRRAIVLVNNVKKNKNKKNRINRFFMILRENPQDILIRILNNILHLKEILIRKNWK